MTISGTTQAKDNFAYFRGLEATFQAGRYTRAFYFIKIIAKVKKPLEIRILEIGVMGLNVTISPVN